MIESGQLISPGFLYGTAWKDDLTELCVEAALEAGFRAIDTANQRKHYHEAGVGAAVGKWLSEGRIERRSLFLQTKFTSIRGQDSRLPYDAEASPAEQVKQSFQSSLDHLRTDYVDSFVLHGPSYSTGVAETDWEIWKAMEGLADGGKVRFLGLSNVSPQQLRIFHEGARIKPRFVQNRCFARTGWDRKTREFCREQGMTYQGFSLLTANPEVFAHPEFQRLVDRLQCTPAQAVFQFCLQLGVLPLTGTTNPAHMREDLDCARFELTPDELNSLESFQAGRSGQG